MQIKTFQAATILELFETIRTRMGPDAVLLWVRRVPSDQVPGGEALEGAAGLDGNGPAPVVSPLLERTESVPVQQPAPVPVRKPEARPEKTAMNLVTRSDASIHCIVGAPKAGKTEGAEKYAVWLRQRTHLPVGLISIDASNLNALERLQRWSGKVQIPFIVARTASELLTHIRSWNERGPLVLDTPGIRPEQAKSMAQIIALLKKAEYSVAVHLAVRVNGAAGECIRALTAYRPLGFDDILPTSMPATGECQGLLELKAWGVPLVSFSKTPVFEVG